jgi:ketosteroid isomerase-like protein
VTDALDIARGVVNVFNGGDLEAAAATFAPDAVMRIAPTATPAPRTLHGAAAILELLHEIGTVFEHFEVEVAEERDLGGGCFLFLARIHAQAASAPVPVETETSWIATVSDGQIVLVEAFGAWNEGIAASQQSQRSGEPEPRGYA